jgi:hypothetical protein
MQFYRTYAPPQAQSVLQKAWHRISLKEPRWLDKIEKLHRAEFRRLLSDVSRPAHHQRVLTFAPVPWTQGCVEHVLADALRLRGHDVHTVLCGGMLPDCEMHYFDFERPPCKACMASGRRYADAFGLSTRFSTEWLLPGEAREAEARTRGLSTDDLLSLCYDSVPVGAIARFQLNVFYQNYLVELDEEQTEQLRKFSIASVLLTKMATRALDALQPNIVMTSNGKAFSYRPLFLKARQRGIRVVTWEEHAFDDQMKFVFSHDAFAGEIHLEEAWETERDRPLRTGEEKKLDDYFQRWQRAENTPFAYHQDTSRDVRFLYDHLGIPGGAPHIACFPNMLRDTLAFDRDVGFKSLLDWILETVRYAEARPDLHFIIKAHPAERCLPEKYGKYNRFFVCEETRRRTSIPSNVHLVEGDSPVNSYTILDECSAAVVYTSTLGLEGILRGRPVCVVGDVHYRRKGFTHDIEIPQDLWDFLDNGPPYPAITEEQRNLARRYAYLWRFRHPFTMPFYDPSHFSFSLSTFERLLPDKDPAINDLCDSILTGSPFVDIGNRPYNSLDGRHEE